MVVINLLHRQLVPLILQHVILQLILWGHDVTCPQADVMQDDILLL